VTRVNEDVSVYPDDVSQAVLRERGFRVYFSRAKRLALALGFVLLVPELAYSQSAQPGLSAKQLVAELRQFRASLQQGAPSHGVLDPIEQKRRSVYDQLWKLGPAALPALNDGLADPDVEIRRNVALFLNVAAGNWYERTRPRLDIHGCLTALIAALADADSRVNGLAAQAVGAIGPDASPAVPALIALLGSAEEGSRNSACIGLTGIGPRARAALPALRKALSDPSPDVKRFAQRAIDAIER
jgi:HEAT repeat protein